MQTQMNTEFIIQTVNTKGFCCSTTFKEVIQGLERIKLPLYMDVTFEGKFKGVNGFTPKKGTYRTTGLTNFDSPYVNDWIQILKFEYTPQTVTGKEELFNIWEYLDYETLYAVMKFDVYVYYRKSLIEDRKNYYIINERGFLVKLEWEEVEDKEEDSYHSQDTYISDLIYSNKQLEEQENIMVVLCN